MHESSRGRCYLLRWIRKISPDDYERKVRRRRVQRVGFGSVIMRGEGEGGGGREREGMREGREGGEGRERGEGG